jgi:hypothetical protein
MQDTARRKAFRTVRHARILRRLGVEFLEDDGGKRRVKTFDQKKEIEAYHATATVEVRDACMWPTAHRSPRQRVTRSIAAL